MLAILICVLGLAMAFVADKMRYNAFPFAADPEFRVPFLGDAKAVIEPS